VSAELREHVAQDRQFTAYDVTRALRESHPDLTIPHDVIRQLVHRYMRNVLGSGRYQAGWAYFGTDVAVLYAPMPALSFLQIPPLALN
jgi:hypothetical protein